MSFRAQAMERKRKRKSSGVLDEFPNPKQLPKKVDLVLEYTRRGGNKFLIFFWKN